MLVLGIAAALWGLGHLLRVPLALRLSLLAGLWAAVVLAHLLLPLSLIHI